MKSTPENMDVDIEQISLNCPACRSIEEQPPFDFHDEGNRRMRTGHECSICGYLFDAWWKRAADYNGFYWQIKKIERSTPINQ